MNTASELVTAAKVALNEQDYYEVAAFLCEALRHLRDFPSATTEDWEWSVVKECCNDIGELIYAHGELTLMRGIYREVYREMGGIAARYLERAWDGCGDGAWRG